MKTTEKIYETPTLRADGHVITATSQSGVGTGDPGGAHQRSIGSVGFFL